MNINILILELRKCILHNDIEYAQQLVRYLIDNDPSTHIDKFYANYIGNRMSVAMYEQTFKPHITNNTHEFENLYVGPRMYESVGRKTFYVKELPESGLPDYAADHLSKDVMKEIITNGLYEPSIVPATPYIPKDNPQ